MDIRKHSGKPDGPKNIEDLYARLNLPKNASAKEIREAYFRLKHTYSNNNQALYSLIEEDDIDASVSMITEAYQVLHRNDTRIAYDKELLLAGRAREGELCADLHAQQKPKVLPKILNEDTVPRVVEIKNPPKTAVLVATEVLDNFVPEVPKNIDLPSVTPPPFQRGVILGRQTARKMIATKALDEAVQEHIKRLVADHDPGDGELYRRIRLTVGVGEEEMQEHIKVSISYIKYLEENLFDLLPQSVYVRGFLKSYLRYLGVANCDRLVTAYTERLNDWIASKNQ